MKYFITAVTATIAACLFIVGINSDDMNLYVPGALILAMLALIYV